MKFGVVVFPGSNCDTDAYHVLRDVIRRETVYLWHKDHDLKGVDCVLLPGGFSYGDYLRSGAIARFSPLMSEVAEFAGRGGLVVGICNGFQILLELGLLPGAMLRNKNLKFLCRFVHLRLENERTPFTRLGRKGRVLRIPIAHYEGNYYAPPEVLKELEEEDRVIFRYSDPEGNLSDESNVNGSLHAIAGIVNRPGNVLGMMPHPERASEAVFGSEDGRLIFDSLVKSLA
ncbi:MAG: phosphoribosylformylglycinamidine synthase I [Candidatus Aminicenantes bacterium RBG_13_63_10]|nr:MAG: phosphoribosylformylglycinamidine synthase I [Candidatus Aminicenantes bacterium RBG_13_63_10]